MADITMCTGKNCPHKAECYRFTAEKNLYRQSIMEAPIDINNLYCSYLLVNVSKSYE